MKLVKNLDTAGRVIRCIIALLLLVYAVWQGSWIALIASIFTFFEVYCSWCVVYQFLGINSCPLNKNKR